MWLNILQTIVGIALVLWDADQLTDDAVAIVERMHMSQIVIGLTIVAMGTSTPEFFVSLLPALKSMSDMVVGNVLGSNIFNSLLIAGCAALVVPMTVLRSTVKRDILLAFVAPWILLMLCLDRHLPRTDAGALFVTFLLYMYFTLKGVRQEPDESEKVQKNYSLPKSIFFLLLGLGCPVSGSNLSVDSATVIIESMGVSDAAIDLTITAGETSMPELAISVVSAHKGQSGTAIGNVLGSNVFNISMILGITGLISPMQPKDTTNLDSSMLVISMVILRLFLRTKYTIVCWEGALLTVAFLDYMSYLVAGA